MPLSLDDARDLAFFWETYEDIERLCSFNRVKEVLSQDHPELMFAWRNFQTSKTAMTAIMRRTLDKIEDES